VHEVGIARALAEGILRAAGQHGAAQVRAAHVRIGVLTAVEPETLGFAFEVVGRELGLARCALMVERPPLLGRCRGCGWSGERSLDELGCPSCGAEGLELCGGRELELVAIDVEEESEDDHA
jgi:hydrogenase nickel incorporation protein HypA/HybF